MHDLFFTVNKIYFASYADDNTPFLSGYRLDDVLASLEYASLKLSDWFSDKQTKANPDKFHLLMSATASIVIKRKHNEILNSESEKLLCVTIDNKPNLNNHLEKILKKANKEVRVSARITQYMSIPKRKQLINSFFIS